MKNWRSTENRYGVLAIMFHWLTLALVLLMVALGVWMEDLPDGSFQRFRAVQLHKSMGITILLLTLARLTWRLIDQPPALMASLRSWQKAASRVSHGALYALLVLVPMAGWATASASTLDLPMRLYGILPWPDLPFTTAASGLTADQEAMEHLFHESHEILIFTLLGVVALHAAAALWHHFRLGDETLARMVPIVGRGSAGDQHDD